MNSKTKSRNACEPCRKRKVKCSGHRPECTHCGRFGLRCEYSQAKRVGRPRRSHPAVDGPHSRSKQSASNVAAATTPSLLASPVARPPRTLVSAEGAFAGPETDHAWLLSPSGPNQSDTQPFDASQWCVPCLIQDGPMADAFLPGGSVFATDFVPPSCQCCEDMAMYFTTVDWPAGTFERVQALRRAMDLANKALHCSVCFDISHGDAAISKNILLLGALMSDIAMSYAHLLFHINGDAASRLDGQRDSVNVIFGLQTQPDAVISTKLDDSTYWQILRGAIVGDLQRLSAICVEFESRQLKAHEIGHESCEPGQPCRYRQQEPASAVSKYIDTCPRSVDPKRTFACFRTVNQVFAAIRDTEKMLVK